MTAEDRRAPDADAGAAAAAFAEHRDVLLGLAYRLLGSMWDAEDVVQEAWLRWSREDRSDVREPRGYLFRVVSRLALDHLRSARVRRETYPGPWLPEPVETAALGPLDRVELADTVAYATLHLMERLSPPERAVFVLREGFSLPYDEIAEILGATAATCRQQHHRAVQRLADGRERFRPSAAEHQRLLTGFLEAAATGDLDRLTGLLAEDVTVWSDGGGKVRAALRPVRGRSKVIAYLLGLLSKNPVRAAGVLDVNGQPALCLRAGEDDVSLVLLDVADGVIHDVYTVRNPDKLAVLGAAGRGADEFSGARVSEPT